MLHSLPELCEIDDTEHLWPSSVCFISQLDEQDHMKGEEGFPEDEAIEPKENLKFGERVGCLS